MLEGGGTKRGEEYDKGLQQRSKRSPDRGWDPRERTRAGEGNTGSKGSQGKSGSEGITLGRGKGHGKESKKQFRIIPRTASTNKGQGVGPRSLPKEQHGNRANRVALGARQITQQSVTALEESEDGEGMEGAAEPEGRQWKEG